MIAKCVTVLLSSEKRKKRPVVKRIFRSLLRLAESILPRNKVFLLPYFLLLSRLSS